MIRILSLLLMALALSGCSISSMSTTTEVTPVSEPQAQHALPTSVQVIEPTAVPFTSTAIPQARPATTPTERPAASPTPTPSPTTSSAPTPRLFSYPIGTPGKPLGDGFFIRHAAAVENTWYNPGYWHTGEDWYALEGDTAGARVYAIADGEVVYAGANYPGRVIIVRHSDALYSMYGHLDPALKVRVGQHVAHGELLGTVLRRSDKTPDHLHFEIRTFLIERQVNGSAPRYGFRCGVNCPPGPGYWPMDAPDLPSDLGWRNPTHVINRRMFPPHAGDQLGEVVVATEPVSRSLTLWSSPPNHTTREALGELTLRPGERYSLLDIYAGPEDSRETSALAYELWYRIRLPDSRGGWVQAAVPSTFETGSDGRPSSIYFNFFPASDATP
jgi:murein DD-endopeptidase MepM/ murein hydrolase activator NlpD